MRNLRGTGIACLVLSSILLFHTPVFGETGGCSLKQGSAPTLSELIDKTNKANSLWAINELAQTIPPGTRASVGHELLIRAAGASIDHNYWTNPGCPELVVKIVQLSAFLKQDNVNDKLEDLQNPSRNEADALESMIGVPSKTFGMRVLWGSPFGFHDDISIDIRNRQYQFIRDTVNPPDKLCGKSICHALPGKILHGLGPKYSPVPDQWILDSGYQPSHGEGSASAIPLSGYFSLLTMGKIAVLMQSFSPEEQVLLKTVMLGGLSSLGWFGIEWANDTAYGFFHQTDFNRSNLSSAGLNEGAILKILQGKADTVFHARYYDLAAADYTALLKQKIADKKIRRALAWKRLISLLADDTSSQPVDFTQISDSGANKSLYQSEFNVLALREAAGQIITKGARKVVWPSDQRLADLQYKLRSLLRTEEFRAVYKKWVREFNRDMHTIVRPDFAVRFLSSQITLIDKYFPPEKRGPFRVHLLTEFLAYAREISYLISFRVKDGIWTRRGDVSPDESEFIEVLEVLKHPERFSYSDKLYASTSPEEDRNSCQQNYTLTFINRDCLKKNPAKKSIPEEVCRTVAQNLPKSWRDMVDWAEQGLHRSPPNYRPYVKLIWASWLGIPSGIFQKLGVNGWRYNPMDDFPLTKPDYAKKVFNKAGGEERAILGTLIFARNFLENRANPEQ